MNTLTSALHEVQSWPSHPTAEDLSRAWRLDWRFLLPDPVLSEVACAVRPASSLERALHEFCDEVTHLDLAGAPKSRHELVVLDQGSLFRLASAAGMVAGGGWLYAEFSRRPCDFLGWLHYPQRCRRRLEHLGFDNVAISWHRPGFDGCVEIIPLADTASRAFVMCRTSANWRSRLKLRIGRALDRTGLLPFVVPCFSVVARKRP